MANVLNDMVWSKTGVDEFKKMLDLAAYKHKLIAGNIANVNTPGYAAKQLDFDTEIKKALGQGPVLQLKTTSNGHIGNVGPDQQVKVTEVGPESSDDLNGVDIDAEISDLSINQMRYTIGARLLAKKMDGLRKAIKGR